jgi:hypothetical protein
MAWRAAKPPEQAGPVPTIGRIEGVLQKEKNPCFAGLEGFDKPRNLRHNAQLVALATAKTIP